MRNEENYPKPKKKPKRSQNYHQIFNSSSIEERSKYTLEQLVQ